MDNSHIVLIPAYEPGAVLIDILKQLHLRFSNIGARIVSAITNYTINRKFVFKSKGNIVKSAAQYFLLAAIILIGNTITLEMLVNICGIHQMIAKILTELLFFILSWTVQKFIILRRFGRYRR